MHIRLKELREELGISQSALAKKLGISQSALGYYERGERLADASTLSKMAEAFSVSTDYLVGRSDAKKPENETLISDLGLSEAAIEVIRSLKTAQPTMTDSSEDARTLLDVFNGFLADTSFFAFLSLIRVLTHAKKWSFTQWEGDDRATPQLSLEDAAKNAFYEKCLNGLLESTIESMKKEDLHIKTRNANVNLFNDKD